MTDIRLLQGQIIQDPTYALSTPIDVEARLKELFELLKAEKDDGDFA